MDLSMEPSWQLNETALIFPFQLKAQLQYSQVSGPIQ